MNVVFVSNYINHHQLPVSEHLLEFCREDGGDYTFIQTEPMEEERVRMGWNSDLDMPSFVRNFWQAEEECQRLIANADVVIFGGTERVELIEERLEAARPIIQYSERVYKEGRWKFITPRGLKKKFHDHTRHNKKPVLLLCAGAYVAGDFRMFGAYPHKKYVYGYFPRFREYDFEELWAKKTPGSEKPIRLLWAARMIDWKHPEVAVGIAKDLKEKGISFRLTMLGNGEELPKIKQYVEEHSLQECVKLPGFASPEETRRYMEESDIFLATSDRLEGWGAVINEAMNSGMAVLANQAMGSAPYLIENGRSGILYKGTNPANLYRRILPIIENEDARKEMGKRAYQRIATLWNDWIAAERLYKVMKALKQGEELPVYEEGPLKKL